MRKLVLLLLIIFGFTSQNAYAATLIVPMDDAQKEHLKAYGLAYHVLEKGLAIEWLLNYRGGSFAIPYNVKFENECTLRGVSYEMIADAQYATIKEKIANPEENMDVVKMEKAPKIAIYSPKTNQPWDDAVTMVLTHAEIPYEVVFDDEVMQHKLPEYDWLHLHHEDFTGQYGKFWSSFRNQNWYKEEVREAEEMAAKWGYAKASQLKLAVVKKIRDFVLGGGYLFAMCSATDTYDIALAADGVDICEHMFDGDAMDPNAQSKLNFENTFAFENFQIVTNPYQYEHSSIDVDPRARMTKVNERTDYFTLFDFSAKWDQIPTMLCQNHTRIVKGFMGQATAFNKKYIKSDVLIMGETKQLNEARYIHGEYGKGMWTFYGGHDPEDYQHFVGEPHTDLKLHPHSPGYRLILNNVLFPAAKKKKRKT
ncbi:MAG: asparagine synthetase B [Bacteroidetes bacterium]|nr:asparagine synthetase B [Bacteroidota bacterium]